MASGIGISLLASAWGRWWHLLLPLGWFLTLAGSRGVQLGIVHHASHGNFTGMRRADDALGRVISILLLIEDYDKYKRGHLIDHHTDALSTLRDPTRQKLERIQLRQGVPPGMLKRRLLLALLNPAHHLREFAGRLASHYRGTGWGKRAGVTAWLSALAATTCLFAPAMLLAWWLPMIAGYEMCSLVRSVVRHWPEGGAIPKGLGAIAARTSANFCGVPLPPRGRTALEEAGVLARWLAAMSIEVICRYLFVNADGPNHDLHHLDARGDWPNHIALREAMREQYARRGILLTESWSFLRTLESHIQAMASPGEGQSHNGARAS
jgi:hypothetical protein